MKKIYLCMVAIAATCLSLNNVNAQGVYWRDGFPRGGTSTFPTATGMLATNPPAYFKSGSGLEWFSYGAYNANTSQTLALNGNTADHIRLLGAAADSAYIVTPTVNSGINEFHFLRTRVGKRFTLYKTTDTLASTNNWVKVAFIAGWANDPCADTVITVNDASAKRLKLVIRQTEDTDIDSIWLTSTGPILPVTFTGVNALQSNGNIKISWNIATEANTVRYEIERSADGRSFIAVGTVNASNAGRYSFMDNSLAAGDIYYRIKAIDKDGAFMYSSILRVNSSRKSPGLTIMSNPVKSGQLNLQLSNFEKGIFTVNLFGNAGQQLFTGKFSNEAGNSSQTIQLPSHIAPGVYMLRLVNGASSITKSVVVE